MPLAISQAKTFRFATPESHLAYSDFLQIAFEGLINAVDKFVLPYTTVFRSVIIGRCKGDMIEAYGDTLLHFYPSDKRKIYRANKVQKGKSREDVNYDDLAHGVNMTGPKLPTPTSPSEIQLLTRAASHGSLDATISVGSDTGEDKFTLMDSFSDNPDNQPDNQTENRELLTRLVEIGSQLTPLEVKFLRLRRR